MARGMSSVKGRAVYQFAVVGPRSGRKFDGLMRSYDAVRVSKRCFWTRPRELLLLTGRPRRHDSIHARIGDRLAKMLAHMSIEEDQNAAAGGLLAEELSIASQRQRAHFVQVLVRFRERPGERRQGLLFTNG